MEWITQPEAWIALATLTTLEIVLGIDNIVFIAIMAGKLPTDQQERARQVGLALALITRILLLLSLTWIMQLTEPIFSLFSFDISGRDIILIVGGLFLLGKSTLEIHEKLEGSESHADADSVQVTFTNVVIQIMLLDIVFSLDSVITAIGLVDQIIIMVIAVVIAVIFMLVFVGSVSAFVDRHPTVKMLALSFLLLIGFTLVGEGLGLHIPKGYIYFAMAFSVFVEMLNIRLRAQKEEPVRLKKTYVGSIDK